MRFKKFLVLFLSFLNKKKINYCILRNYKNFPYSNSSKDIDILIDKKNLRQINNFLLKNYHVTNFNERKNVVTYFITNILDGKKRALHLDLITEISWKGLKYFSNHEIFKNSKIYQNNKVLKIPSNYHQAIITLFSSYLIGGWIKMKYQSYTIRVFKSQRSKTINVLQNIAGEKLAIKIYNFNINKEYNQLIKILKYIKLRIIFYNFFKNPIIFILNIFKHYQKEIKIRFTHYPLNEFCFLGVDGVGKSSIIKTLSKKLDGSAQHIKIIHLKHSLFEFEKKSSSNKIPHKGKPRSVVISVIKIFYWLYCYHYKKIFHGYKNSTIILWDRYMYDILIDPIRYKIKLPKTLFNLSKIIVPKPDYTFILTGRPKDIFKRKKELTLNEIKNYNSKYLQISYKLKNSKIIDTSRGINNTSDKILNDMKIILKKASIKKVGKTLY
jgi:thymidylate kinase